MFTGIAEGKYPIEVYRREQQLLLQIDMGTYGDGLVPGASVAVNGVCLTVIEIENQIAKFEVVSETVATTNLGKLGEKDWVNIERSFRVGDEVGGHILSGHVATCVEVTSCVGGPSEVQLQFRVPKKWGIYLMPKGFVALNGCSLTLADFDRDLGIGQVNLIPETMRRTTFGSTKKGDMLNLEVDSQSVTVVETVRELLNDKEWLKSLR